MYKCINKIKRNRCLMSLIYSKIKQMESPNAVISHVHN